MQDSTLPLPSHAYIFDFILRTIRRPPCFLITNSVANASPSARLVGTLPPPVNFTFSKTNPEQANGSSEDDDNMIHSGDRLVLTITSNAYTRKYEELLKNAFVSLAFHDAATTTQIICKGKLDRMITDEAELKKNWWFPDRHDKMFTAVGVPNTKDTGRLPDPFEHRFIVLQFHITEIEVMALNITPPIADHWMGWRPVTVSWQGEGRWKVDRRNLRRFWADEKQKL